MPNPRRTPGDRAGDADRFLRRRLLPALVVAALAGTVLAGVTYEYDDAGRLTRALYDDGASITYTYDANGNLLSRTSTAATRFHRGDANADGEVDLSDAVFVLLFLFPAGEAESPPCQEAADANNDALLDISDATFLLSFIFSLGDVPPLPGPPGEACGLDPEPPGLGCESYPPCE